MASAIGLREEGEWREKETRRGLRISSLARMLYV
jgi:hypothetical protein